MLELPPDFDVRLFVGHELESVEYWKYTINLSFDRNLRLRVSSSIKYQIPTDNGSTLIGEDTPPLTSSNLMMVICGVVERATVLRKADLHLEFTGGAVLTIMESAEPYESWQIDTEPGGERFYVV